MERAKIVDHFLAKVSSEKDFNIYEVRQELEKHNFEEEEIKQIVRIVDNELQRTHQIKSNNKKATDLMWVGAVLTVIGIGVTLGTYTGLLPMGNSFLITYGPFLGGLSILFGAMAKKRRI
jgi:hypothetical protein